MNEENQNIGQNTPPRGRTWADVFVNGSYILGAGLFLVGMGAAAYFILGEVPTWFFIALASSVIFIPFLHERAKDGTDLILVTDEPFKLTEGLSAQTSLGNPASTEGGGEIVTTKASCLAAHNTLPVDIKSNVTFPAKISAADGVYNEFKVNESGE